MAPPAAAAALWRRLSAAAHAAHPRLLLSALDARLVAASHSASRALPGALPPLLAECARLVLPATMAASVPQPAILEAARRFVGTQLERRFKCGCGAGRVCGGHAWQRLPLRCPFQPHVHARSPKTPSLQYPALPRLVCGNNRGGAAALLCTCAALPHSCTACCRRCLPWRGLGTPCFRSCTRPSFAPRCCHFLRYPLLLGQPWV